jgi:hypothetical protein
LNLGSLVHLGGLNASREHQNKKGNPIWPSLFFFFSNLSNLRVQEVTSYNDWTRKNKSN